MSVSRALALTTALLLLGFRSDASAQGSTTLSAGSHVGLPGGSGIIPISLGIGSGDEVSGLNFDLGFDDERVRVGSASLGPGAPGVFFRYSEPSAGILRVLLIDLDGNPVSGGVVVNVDFNILSGASGGTFPLDLIDTAITNPAGTGVPHSSNSGSFTVQTPTDTPTPTPTFTNTPTPTHTPTPSNTPTPTNTPIPTTPGPSPTPSDTPPPTATHTPGPSPTPTSTPTQRTATPTSTATITASPTTTLTTTPEAGEGLELEGAAGATATAIAVLEAAVEMTSTALAESGAKSGTDRLIGTVPPPGLLGRPELYIAAGLLIFAVLLAGGAGYLIWRRQQD